MAGIAVSVSMGVMKPLLDKLATLMGDEYKKIKGLRKEVSFLKDELSDMNGLLENMDDADELDPQAKKWRKDIIEMSYNIEDYIDDFMARVGESGDNVGVLHKASYYLRTFKDRRRMANQFQEIKRQVIEAGERRERYKLDQCVTTTPATVVVDPRLSALYKNSASLVGIDSQKEEIVKWVMDDEGTRLKVMSIVGFGGLGKTTLANEVYREVSGEFDCKAFVSISQNPDIIKLLNSITLQLGLQPYPYACQLQDRINNIRQRLQDKRYLIVIDDLWDIQAWNDISCAFPQNNHRSRVMITTRINDVARVSCGQHGFIHSMKPLSEEDSTKLFFDRICEFGDPCPCDIMEASCNILKKCGGLPLAIITMASMIACQPTRSKRQWAKYIQNSLGVEFATNPSYEGMMRIIDFSYKNLPRHLKACFLYLGTYPEDHEISRVDLVRRWVAEGFVSCSHGGQDIWDVAESYFNELVNRSMIQPVYKGYDPIVANCRVHDMILELILRKCSEDNFISLTVDSPDRMLGGQYKFIRRLTFDGRRRIEDTMQLSHVRSLNIFSVKYWIPNLAEFKFIRVLFLNVNGIAVDIDLSGINQLSQLRYLRIDGYGNKILLPAQIRGLRLLETLSLSAIGWVPEIVDAPRLSHVSVVDRVRLPNKIGTMKSLLSVTGFYLDMSSLESIVGLGELTALSKLTLYAAFGSDELAVPLIAALITSLENLHNLKYLSFDFSSITYCGDAMLASSYSPAFRNIEWLDLTLVIFSSVPTWIGHLCCLRMLNLTAKQIHQEDFNMIGTRLASLFQLSLYITQVPTNRIVIEGSTGFKVLKSFLFDCDGSTTCLTFEADAMPDLQRLTLIFDPLGWDETSPLALQHLPSLKTITLFPAKPYTSMNHFDVTQDEEMRTIKMWDVFERIANTLPTRPTVRGQKFGWWGR